MQEELKRLGEPAKADAGVGALQMAIFEAVAESKLIQPTYIIDYPVEISPLARASDKVPGITERFELFMAGNRQRLLRAERPAGSGCSLHGSGKTESQRR